MTGGFAALAAALTRRAAQLAQARRLARRDPARAWRKPGLLWPTFTGD